MPHEVLDEDESAQLANLEADAGNDGALAVRGDIVGGGEPVAHWRRPRILVDS